MENFENKHSVSRTSRNVHKIHNVVQKYRLFIISIIIIILLLFPALNVLYSTKNKTSVKILLREYNTADILFYFKRRIESDYK